jgi:hypothetical protein
MERFVGRDGRLGWKVSKPNGRLEYMYDKCSCGSDKNLKSRYCNPCNQKRLGYESRKVRKIQKKIDVKVSKDFVSKIMARNGMCSTNELFVELIDIYEMNFGEQSGLDNLEAREQLLIMWNKLKEKYK